MCEAARKILKPVERAATNAGTDCHEIVAIGMRYAVQENNGEPRQAMKSLAEVDEYLKHAIEMRWPKLSGWDRWAVAQCLIFVFEKIEQYGITPENVLIEHRMDGEEFGMEKGGTADIVLVVPFKMVYIIDWKFGIIEVDSADVNDQQSAYAIMAARTFKTDKVLVSIVQPKLERNQRITSATYSAYVLKGTENWVLFVCLEAQNENAKLAAAYEQCHYCDSLLLCIEAKEYIMRAIEALQLFGLPSDPQGWADLIGAVKLAERFAEEGKEASKQYLHDGGTAPGWKLRPGGSVSNLKDVESAYAIAKANGMQDTFIKACSLKLGELKTLYGPDTVDALFGRLIETKDKGPSLVATKSKD
jgi:hypothetical protein